MWSILENVPCVLERNVYSSRVMPVVETCELASLFLAASAQSGHADSLSKMGERRQRRASWAAPLKAVEVEIVSPGDWSWSWVVLACVLSSFSRVWLSAALWTLARQAPLSVGFSRPEHWSGFPCPCSGDLPDPGTEPASRVSCVGRQVRYHSCWLRGYIMQVKSSCSSCSFHCSCTWILCSTGMLDLSAHKVVFIWGWRLD